VRRFVVVVLAFASLLARTPASAQERIAATGQVHVLDTEQLAEGSEPAVVHARLETTDATRRLLVELRVQCDSGQSVWTTQNMGAGQGRTVLNARALLDADSQCQLQVRALMPGFPGGDPDASFAVASAQLTATRGGYASRRQSTQVLPVGGAVDTLKLSWTAPDDVQNFRVTADAQLTNCYGPARDCTTEPVNTGDSVVDTRLIVSQRAENGAYCAVTHWPAQGMDRTTVTWTEHHQKNYHRVPVHVSDDPGCTRSFLIKVHARHVHGNEALIEGPSTGIDGYYSTLFVHE
jgi:hypothetical protein